MSPEADLTRRWAEGWTVSRGTPPPVPAAWGLSIEVGEPDQLRRHVLLDPLLDPESVGELAASVVEPHTCDALARRRLGYGRGARMKFERVYRPGADGAAG